jgi:spore germination protein YaaH
MSAVGKGLVVLLLAFVLAVGNAWPGSSIKASAHTGVAALAHTQGRSAFAAGSPSLKREVFGFALASTLSDPTVGYPTWNFSLLSTVAFFGLHVQDDGTFASDSGRSVWNSSQVGGLLSAAHSHGARVLLTIVMQDFGAGTPHMCSALVHQATTISATVAEVKAKGVDGVNVDYEGLNGSCGTADASFARRDLTNFMSGLRSALGSGYYLSIDTYASSASDSLGFFDVPGLAPIVDSMFVMAYDLEYSNYAHAPPGCVSFCLGPTAPLTGYYYNDTAAAAQYAGTIALSKIILGVPYYGRKACVGSATPNQIPNPSSSVAADSYVDASGESTAPQVQAGSYAVHRDANDPAGQERWDTWFNTSLNCTRELYWDDPTSLGLKYDLVNRDGLRGVGIWNLNYGGGAPELWGALAAHFSLVPGQPGNLSVCAGQSRVTVSWAPAATLGTPITGYQVTANPGGISVTVPANVTIADMLGLTPGTAYTVSVQAINSAGTGLAATSPAVTPTSGAPTYEGFLNWYDRASPGVVSDNIHIFNPGGSASSGCVTVNGTAVVPWTAGAGQQTYVSMPVGVMGGPVRVSVNSGPAVKISQRVQFGQSFNEIWAEGAAQAATTSYFNWYDKASPGMVADNIHLFNPSGATANVTVSLPGATPQKASIAPGYTAFLSFPRGTIGGPVTVTSDQAVLASQRVQFNQTFNETWALTSAQAATTAYLNWYDTASAGMVADNIHLLNPGGTSASVTVGLPGTAPLTVTVGAGAEVHVSLGAGKIGGPVKITSSQPVLASQRVDYYSSFNEVPALTTAQATGTSFLNWYDRVSPGMVADNVHLLNPGTAAATVTVSLPGAKSITVTVSAGAESYVSFPAGTMGGALTITSTQPLLASQRVQYYLTFNEIPAG